jgi:hypothetical protein
MNDECCVIMSSHSVILMSSFIGSPCYQRQHPDDFMVV